MRSGEEIADELVLQRYKYRNERVIKPKWTTALHTGTLYDEPSWDLSNFTIIVIEFEIVLCL